MPISSTVISPSGIHPASPTWEEVRPSLSLSLSLSSSFSHSSLSYIDKESCINKIVLLTFFLFLYNFLSFCFFCIAFAYAYVFNSDLSKWDTSSVTTMWSSTSLSLLLFLFSHSSISYILIMNLIIHKIVLRYFLFLNNFFYLVVSFV